MKTWIAVFFVFALVGCGREEVPEGYTKVSVSSGGFYEQSDLSLVSQFGFSGVSDRPTFRSMAFDCSVPFLELVVKGPPGSDFNVSVPNISATLDPTLLGNLGANPFDHFSVDVLVPNGPNRTFQFFGGVYSGCANVAAAGVKSYPIYGRTPPIDLAGGAVQVNVIVDIPQAGFQVDSSGNVPLPPAQVTLRRVQVDWSAATGCASAVSYVRITDLPSGFEFYDYTVPAALNNPYFGYLAPDRDLRFGADCATNETDFRLQFGPNDQSLVTSS